jgi:hypothetical protein
MDFLRRLMGSALKKRPIADQGPETVWQTLGYGPSRELVRSKIEQVFPEEAEAEVLRLLDLYGVQPHEPERERVQLAILKLSDGDKEQLRLAVSDAKMDFRNVLAWAEYPEQMRGEASVDSGSLRSIEQQDRQQYLDWLGRDNRIK